MKVKSALVTEMSGSIGGLVASHNRGGQYFRARVIPTNPNTPEQQQIRSIVAYLTGFWLSGLTGIQRAAWDLYAEQVKLPDRLGEPRNIGGISMFVRSNTPRLQVGLPRVDAGPTTFNLGDYQGPTFTPPSEATQDTDITFPILDAWVNETGAAMLLFGSRPQNASVNYFKGPYRTMAHIVGDLVAPPVPPITRSLAFPFVLGQKCFFRYNVTRVDGRLGAEGHFGIIAVA